MPKQLGVSQKSAEVVVPLIAHQRSREGLNVFEQGRTIHDLDTSDIIGTPTGQSCAAIRKKPALASGANLLLKDEPPSADPHARWCGRGPGAIRAPIPIGSTQYHARSTFTVNGAHQQSAQRAGSRRVGRGIPRPTKMRLNSIPRPIHNHGQRRAPAISVACRKS